MYHVPCKWLREMTCQVFGHWLYHRDCLRNLICENGVHNVSEADMNVGHLYFPSSSLMMLHRLKFIVKELPCDQAALIQLADSCCTLVNVCQ